MGSCHRKVQAPGEVIILKEPKCLACYPLIDKNIEMFSLHSFY